MMILFESPHKNPDGSWCSGREWRSMIYRQHKLRKNKFRFQLFKTRSVRIASIPYQLHDLMAAAGDSLVKHHELGSIRNNMFIYAYPNFNYITYNSDHMVVEISYRFRIGGSI